MKYTLDLEIDAPRARVATLFADIDKLACWQPGFMSAERLSGETEQPGEKLRLLYENRGREVEMIETIEIHNLPEEFSSSFVAKGMHMVVRNLFEETSTNGTHWITHNEANVSGFMMRAIALIMPGSFRKQSSVFMRNFKDFVENGTDIRDR